MSDAVSVRLRRLVRLDHPRLDRWNEHFRLAAARIIPLTDVGEATVQLLNLMAQKSILTNFWKKYPPANGA